MFEVFNQAESRLLMTSSEQWSPADIPLASEPVPAATVRRRLHAEEPVSADVAKPCASDEMCQRLREASLKCQDYYTAWKQSNSGESELSDSLHELRRAVARIEIEIAASHSNDGALRPIPIPLHRAHK